MHGGQSDLYSVLGKVKYFIMILTTYQPKYVSPWKIEASILKISHFEVYDATRLGPISVKSPWFKFYYLCTSKHLTALAQEFVSGEKEGECMLTAMPQLLSRPAVATIK